MSASFVPHSHIPYGKDGSGFYTDNTIGCFRVIDAAAPLALKAIGKVSQRRHISVSVSEITGNSTVCWTVYSGQQ